MAEPRASVRIGHDQMPRTLFGGQLKDKVFGVSAKGAGTTSALSGRLTRGRTITWTCPGITPEARARVGVFPTRTAATRKVAAAAYPSDLQD